MAPLRYQASDEQLHNFIIRFRTLNTPRLPAVDYALRR